MKPRTPTTAALVLILAVVPAACLAAPPSCTETAGWPDDPAQLSLRMDNDAFGSASQYEGYSNGLVVARGRWTLTLAQYQRSREFEGQADTPSYGSLGISRAF